jgi:hypothetical protein
MNENVGDSTFSLAGAEELAARLRAFWRVRGHKVKVWVEQIRTHAADQGHAATMFCVRSNLLCGRPATDAANDNANDNTFLRKAG